jgi:hypothetical protein
LETSKGNPNRTYSFQRNKNVEKTTKVPKTVKVSQNLQSIPTVLKTIQKLPVHHKHQKLKNYKKAKIIQQSNISKYKRIQCFFQLWQRLWRPKGDNEGNIRKS